MRMLKKILLLFSILFLSPFCFSDGVVIEWQKSPHAKQYELKVSDEDNTVFVQRFEQDVTSWKAQLPVGPYQYQIRIYDSDGRAGPWSPPTSFVVAPPPPRLIFPADGSTVLFQPSSATSLKWEEVQGIETYIFQLTSKDALSVRRIVVGTETTLTNLAAGEYSWSVQPVFEIAKKKSEKDEKKGTQLQVLETQSSPVWKFKVEFVQNAALFEGDLQELKLLASEKSPIFEKERTVCLYPSKKAKTPVACGRILSSKYPNLELTLLSQNKRLQVGRKVYLIATDEKRSIGSLRPKEAFLIVEEKTGYDNQAGVGIMAGVAFFVSMIEIQKTIIPTWVLGFRGAYAADSSAGPTVRLLGAAATLRKYLGPSNFSGFFGEVGAGTLIFLVSKTGTSETKFVPQLLLQGGWQIRPELQGFNGTVALGVQWLTDPNLTLVRTKLSGILPVLTLSFGYSF